MKFYKNTQNEVYAYESDGSQDAFIKPNLTLISEEVANQLRNPPKSLAELKLIKEFEIRNGYVKDSDAPVLVSGIYWNGGFDSAIKLDAAMRLSQAAQQPSVTFFDIDNLPHNLSYPDALVIVVSVASLYQLVLKRKQDLFKLISNATLDTIKDITW
jgi:hypothetical protein